uniref:Uncharacterized protein n=1 Tax=Poecilia reticulata TaxID=8081 RepID=A0A3P9PBU5_POERE
MSFSRSFWDFRPLILEILSRWQKAEINAADVLRSFQIFFTVPAVTMQDFWGQIMHQPLMDCEALKEKLDATLEDMKQPLDLLEEKFLQDKPFIIGNKISGRPKLTAWRGRVKKQLGVKLVDQAHEALLDQAHEALLDQAHEALLDQAHEALLDLSGLQQKMQNNTELQKLKPVFLKYFH